MKLLLKRIHLKETYTVGELHIDGVYFCDTMEDKVRDLNKDGDLNDVGETKIYEETAIPYGTYEVQITYSNRFKKLMPILLNVKGFEGIRLHGGNTAADSHGCPLLGINDEVGKVTKSTITFNKFMPLLEEGLKKGKVFITIS